MTDEPSSSNSSRTNQKNAHLRDLFASFPSGVTIVTSSNFEGDLQGTTVSAFAPVSLNPALVLISLDQKSRTAAAISERKAFVIHLLDFEKADLATHFAKDFDRKFDGISHTLNAKGIPIINECQTYIECTLATRHYEGDHVLIIGTVDQIENSQSFKPLIYHQRSFHSLDKV